MRKMAPTVFPLTALLHYSFAHFFLGVCSLFDCKPSFCVRPAFNSLGLLLPLHCKPSGTSVYLTVLASRHFFSRPNRSYLTLNLTSPLFFFFSTTKLTDWSRQCPSLVSAAGSSCKLLSVQSISHVEKRLWMAIGDAL